MKHTTNPLKQDTANAVAIVIQIARKDAHAGHCAYDAGAGHSANEKEEHRPAPLDRERDVHASYGELILTVSDEEHEHLPAPQE